jgi:hypothetical protein
VVKSVASVASCADNPDDAALISAADPEIVDAAELRLETVPAIAVAEFATDVAEAASDAFVVDNAVKSEARVVS